VLGSELLEIQRYPFLLEQCAQHFDKQDIQVVAMTKCQGQLDGHNRHEPKVDG
jgi:hypothetical protein